MPSASAVYVALRLPGDHYPDAPSSLPRNGARGSSAVGVVGLGERRWHKITVMGTQREERIARNEAIFRVGNERMAQWEERHEESERERYLCECADPVCTDKIELTKSQYEYVRSESRWFVVVPGHEVPDVEKVVDSHEGWNVIEKTPDVAHITESTDPRQD